jgi:hypothetical protein
MTIATLGRYYPGLFSVVAKLTACGGSQSPGAVVPNGGGGGGPGGWPAQGYGGSRRRWRIVVC